MNSDNTEVESITDWANPPTVADLKADFEAAKGDTDRHTADVEEWLNLLNIEGSEKPKSPTGKSRVQPKLIRKQNEWRYPSLTEPFLSSYDLCDVDPTTYEDKNAAVQNALVLNNQINTKIDKVSFIDEYVRTGVDEGTVIVKTSWIYEEDEVEEPSYEYEMTQDPQEMDRIQMLMQMAQNAPQEFAEQVPEYMQMAVAMSMENRIPIVPIENGTQMAKHTTKNFPKWEVCEYDHLCIDPTAKGDMEAAQFIIHSFDTSMSDLKKDGRYSNLDKIDTNTANPLGADYDTDTGSFTFKDKPRQKLVLHEYWGYWDIDGTGVTKPIVAAYINNTMVRLEDNPFPDGKLPFVSVQMLPKRKSNFGEPDAELIGDNQRIVGAVTRGMVDTLARGAAGQRVYTKGVLDITNKRRLDSGADIEINPGIPADQAVHVLKFPELPQSAANMIQYMTSDAESVVGVRPFAQSQTGSIGSETATGVKTANDATGKRDTAILRRFGEGIIKLCRKTLAMNQVFLSEEEVVRITNEEFVTVKRDDLLGDFDLKISISTAEEDNAKAQELAFMMQTMGNNMDPEMSKLMLSEMFTLRNMPVLAKKMADFQPQPDPMQQKIQQLEVAKLEAEIAKIQSETGENAGDTALKEAKTQTELARGRQLGSSADLQDLDFLEKDSGKAHADNLEIISQQSKAQGDTKRLEADLKHEADKHKDHRGAERALFDAKLQDHHNKQAQSNKLTKNSNTAK